MGRGAHQHTLSPLPLQATFLTELLLSLEDAGWFSGPHQAQLLADCGCLRGEGGYRGSGVRTGWSNGARVPALPWDLSLVSDLILPCPHRGGGV